MWTNKKFLDALFFATKAHESQRMQYPDDMPYSAHIYGVLQFAVKGCVEGNDDPDWDLLVQCALLHDTIEDTDTTYAMLENKFGKKVADGVLALSKNPELDKDIQMTDCIKRIKNQPKEIAIVKLADRLFNMRGKVLNWSEEKQEYYKKEAQLICDELGYGSLELKSQLQRAIDNY